MATITYSGVTWNTTAGNKTVTATPAVGDLIVVVAGTSGLSGGTTNVTDNNSSGTYSQVDTDRTGFSTTGTLTIWVRTSFITSASSTIFTAAQTGSTGGGLAVFRISGMPRAGVTAVRSNGGVSSGTGGTTPAPVLSSTPLIINPIIAAVANGSSPAGITPRSSPSYSEAQDNGYPSPATGLETSYLNSGETSATITHGGTSVTNYATVAIELSSATYGVSTSTIGESINISLVESGDVSATTSSTSTTTDSPTVILSPINVSTVADTTTITDSPTLELSGGATIPSQAGTASLVQSNTVDSSTSVTVPTGTDCVILFASYWDNSADQGFTSITLGGDSFTLVRLVDSYETTGNHGWSGVWRLNEPSTGTQTFAWDYVDTDVTEGFNFYLVYLKDVDTSSDPIRGFGAAMATSAGGNQTLTTDSFSTSTADLCLVGGYSYTTTDGNAAPDGSGQTEILDSGVYNSCELVIGTKDGTSGTTTMQFYGSYPSCVAVSVKGGTPEAIVSATTASVSTLSDSITSSVSPRNINTSSTTTLNDSIVSKAGDALASTSSTTTLNDVVTSQGGDGQASTISASTLNDTIDSQAGGGVAEAVSVSTVNDVPTAELQTAVEDDDATTNDVTTLSDVVTPEVCTTTLDQQQTNTGNFNTVRYTSVLNVKVGQSFVPSVTAEICYVTFNNKRIGSPSGNVWAEIYSDDGDGLPNALLATSDSRNVTAISGTATDYNWNFTGINKIQLTSGTMYHVVLSGDWSYSTTDGIQIATTSESNNYANGTHVYYATSWAIYANDDMYFKTYYDDCTVELSDVNASTSSTSTLSDSITSKAGDGVASTSSISTLSDSLTTKGGDASGTVVDISTLSDSLTTVGGAAIGSTSSTSTINDAITAVSSACLANTASVSTLADIATATVTADNDAVVVSTSTLSDAITAQAGDAQANIASTTTLADVVIAERIDGPGEPLNINLSGSGTGVRIV
jgi:hypothetical protein